MAKTKTVARSAARRRSKAASSDGAYLLKLVLYMILGLQWLWVLLPNGASLPLPIGLLIGLGFTAHEHFRIDRKIEYAVLLAALLAGFIAHVGVALTL